MVRIRRIDSKIGGVILEVDSLKKYIIDNDLIIEILEKLGCHHVRDKGDYISAANPDGDNPSAITVYKNENLTTKNYTRNILRDDIYSSDLITLVEFFEKCNFFEALKKISGWIDLDFYHDFEKELPESIKITKMILEMQRGIESTENDRPLKPISEKILNYYPKRVNDMFLKDGIDYNTQNLFEIGYCDRSNRIAIPIRDEIGTLIGIKGRLFQKLISENEMKYIYLEPCSRSKILYGIYLTLPYIKEKKICYVTESEKAVQQLWSMGYKNSCGIGGKNISKEQINKLTRLCVEIVFLFDKDVSKNELEEIADRFVENQKVYAVIDANDILGEKESPTDNKEKFELLIKNNLFRIR